MSKTRVEAPVMQIQKEKRGKTSLAISVFVLSLTLSGPDFLWVPGPRRRGGGGGWKVPATRNSKTIHDIEMKVVG